MNRRLVILAASMLVAIGVRPVGATTITMDFSGTVNLSGVGGPASNPYSGSVAWDPTAAPAEMAPTFAVYPVISQSFIFDASDQSANIGNAAIRVFDNPAFPASRFDFTFGLSTLVPVAGSPDFVAAFIGSFLFNDADLFPSLSLPTSLDFLAARPLTSTRFVLAGSPGTEAFGSITANGPASTVPEPTTLTLLGTGAAGLAARRRSKRRV